MGSAWGRTDPCYRTINLVPVFGTAYLGWSRTWGEEHFGNGKVHKYGNSTTGESWDIVVDEETYYEAEPHYGWADVVGASIQLLSIQPQEKPPGGYTSLDFGSSPPETDDPPYTPPTPLE